jgi:hypothetical protein
MPKDNKARKSPKRRTAPRRPKPATPRRFRMEPIPDGEMFHLKRQLTEEEHEELWKEEP